jgi:hypothetical protein
MDFATLYDKSRNTEERAGGAGEGKQTYRFDMLGLVIVAEERAVDVLGGSGIELGDRILGGKASTRHLTHSLHLLLLIPRPAHTHRLQHAWRKCNREQ